MPRCLYLKHPTKDTLVGFADPPSLGYAAVLYLKTHYSDDENFVALLTSKTRLG